MSKTTLIIVTVVVLATSAAIVGWSFFGLGTSPAPSKTQVSTNQATQSAQVNKEFPTVPVSIKNPAVKAAFVTYRFVGTIKELQGSPGKLQLITDITGGRVPKFIVTPITKVSSLRNDQKTQASPSDLKPGQEVGIAIIYRMKKRTWDYYVTSVDILISTPSASTPSASLQ